MEPAFRRSLRWLRLPARVASAASLTCILLALVLPVSIPDAAAQNTPDTSALLQVLVVEAGTTSPLAGAQVSVGGRARASLTDRQGMVEIPGIAGDSMVLELRMVGYAARSLVVTPTADIPLFVTVPLELAPAILAPVRVEIEGSRRSAALRDFYERARRGPGQFLTRSDIERRSVRNLGDLFRTMPGIGLTTTAFGETPVMEAKGSVLTEPGGGECSIQYFVDGTPVTPPAGAIGFDVDLSEVEGIEIYRRGTHVPARYQRQHGSCGVVLIWKRESLGG